MVVLDITEQVPVELIGTSEDVSIDRAMALYIADVVVDLKLKYYQQRQLSSTRQSINSRSYASSSSQILRRPKVIVFSQNRNFLQVS